MSHDNALTSVGAVYACNLSGSIQQAVHFLLFQAPAEVLPMGQFSCQIVHYNRHSLCDYLFLARALGFATVRHNPTLRMRHEHALASFSLCLFCCQHVSSAELNFTGVCSCGLLLHGSTDRDGKPQGFARCSPTPWYYQEHTTL